MGVLPCSRKDCENIMCDTYVHGIWYVCNECKKEFEEYMFSVGKEEISEGEIRRELRGFMETTKSDFNTNKVFISNFFDQYTK